jgi:Phage ABA sandwich domain
MPETTTQIRLREIDRQIAERVMGWEPVAGQTALAPFAYKRPDGHTVHPYSAPEYSSSLEAAMLVVDHYRRQGVTITLETNPHGTWRCSLRGPEGEGFTEAGYESTMPLAICRAVLSEFGIA